MSVQEKFQLNGNVAVVTGAFGKLGCAWTEVLLEAEGKVAALDRAGIEPSETQKQLQQQYGADKLKFYAGDVTDKDQLKQVRAQIQQELGAIHILVNNAGIDQPPGQLAQSYHLHDVPLENFTRVLDVNTTGAFLCMQVFGEAMLAHGNGRIINIGSLYASVSPDVKLYDHFEMDPPFLKPPAYGASKAALVNLTKFFSAHWGPKGIRVNALSPGGVEGGQDPQFKQKFCSRVPLGRMAVLDDLKGPMLFLASDASRYVTGIELRVDGGFTVW